MPKHLSRDMSCPAPQATSPRTLVLHADDLGMNEAVNRGILCGFEQGLLTSASVLMNAPHCARAISGWKELHERRERGELPSCQRRRQLGDSGAAFDLGVHLNLTQGRPITGERYPPDLLDEAGRFPGAYALARRLMFAGVRFRPQIECELSAQIEALLDLGIAPTHLNAHQYIDMLPAVSAIVPALLHRYAIGVVRVPWERRLTRTTLLRLEPANWCLAQVKRMFAFRYYTAAAREQIAHPSAYFGTSHAGRIDLELMRTFVTPAGAGCTEIGMHPGASAMPSVDGGADGWYDPLAAFRPGELALLCSTELAELFAERQFHLGRLSALHPARARRAA